MSEPKEVPATVEKVETQEFLSQSLAQAINMHSREGHSDTPDYILAEFLMGCLGSFERAISERNRHAGTVRIGGAPVALSEEVEGALSEIDRYIDNDHKTVGDREKADRALRTLRAALAQRTVSAPAKFERKVPVEEIEHVILQAEAYQREERGRGTNLEACERYAATVRRWLAENTGSFQYRIENDTKWHNEGNVYKKES